MVMTCELELEKESKASAVAHAKLEATQQGSNDKLKAYRKGLSEGAALALGKADTSNFGSPFSFGDDDL